MTSLNTSTTNSFVGQYKTVRVADVQSDKAGTSVFLLRSDSDFIRLSCAVRSVAGTLSWKVYEYYAKDGFHETEIYSSPTISAPEVCETQVRSGQLRVEITYSDAADFELIGFGTNGQGLSGALLPAGFDYVSNSPTATTDVWIYKAGGTSGSVVGEITVTYADSTKCEIISVERTV